MSTRRPDRAVAPIVIALACALAVAGCATGTPTAATSTPAAATSARSTGTSSAAATSSTTASTTGSAAGSGLGLPGVGKPPVTIGDKNYTEQFVLGELYELGLQDQGFSVQLNRNIGPTDVTLQALKTGTLSMYPEYLNVFQSAIANIRHSFHTSLGAYLAAQRYAVAHGLTLLAPTPFSDTDAVAVTDGYAAANRLRALGDLAKVSPALTVGGPPQFQQGNPGLPTIERRYHFIAPGFRTLAVGNQYAALNSDTVQAAAVQTTDGQLASGDYRVLGDPDHMFGWGNVVPVVPTKVLVAEGPAFADTINRIDALLTTAVMRRLNQAVDIAGQDPAAVAQQFLETHGLIAPAPQ
jgi:osmoprotectant transport system substrate-binding protein